MRPKLLQLSNFKAIGKQPQRIELAPITLLFGPNSAGKSTVLQSLIYLREVISRRNYDPDTTLLGGDWLDLGGFRNLVHGRDLNEAITITVAADLEPGELPNYLTDHEQEELEQASDHSGGSLILDDRLDSVESIKVSISIQWSDSLNAPLVNAVSVELNDKPLARLGASHDRSKVYFDEINLSHPLFALEDASELEAPSLTAIQLFKTAYSKLEVENAYQDVSLEQLAEIVKSGLGGNQQLGNRLLTELSTRSSRKAAKLADKVRHELESIDDDEEVSYVGILNTDDALPDTVKGIKLDDAIWIDQKEWEAEFDPDADKERNVYSAARLTIEAMLSSYVAGSVRLIQEWVEETYYIGPLRDLPPRVFQPQRTPDRSRWSKGLAAWELLHTAEPSVIKDINWWLGERCLKTGYQVEVSRFRELPTDAPFLTLLDREEIDADAQELIKEAIDVLPTSTRVTMLEEETGLEVMPQDIGVGISQVFPVVALTVAQETGLIAIEQPELHVHPAIQIDLADLFARYAINHNKLLLLESHSEHLILRLLRRIRDAATHTSDSPGLSKDDVSVQYVEPTSEGTGFSRLRIDSDGDFIDEWPNGFFDERDEELF